MSRAASLRRAARLPLAALACAALVVPLSVSPATAATSGPSPAPLVPSVRPLPPLPAVPVTVSLSPRSGSVVGVAYPITATFSAPVADRAAAERHMHVYVNNVFSRGAWYWRSSTVALFRTPGFWPGHSTVSVRLSLSGVELRRTSDARYLGSASTTRAYAFRTARALVAKVDAVTDRFTVFVDNVKVKVFLTSLGKPGFETRSGIKSVMEKYALRHMTSVAAGITDPRDQYDLQVPWAVRITPSGEFVHGAPWATARLGRYNGSHGCTNLSTADAHWFFDNVITGDPVVTTGTGRPMEYWNGLGAPYNMPWTLWLSQSALKGQP